jgi:hypothetical protein
MKHILILLGAVLLLQSCSINKLVIRQTGALLDYGVLALYEEPDLILAEQALASDIKLLEGMIKGDPGNEDLLLLTSQAMSGYALGFTEDTAPDRAKRLYLRARDYGLEVLRENDAFAAAETAPQAQFESALQSFDTDDTAALFWAAFAWAGWINLSLDDPQALIDLSRVQAMMQRVVDLDPGYFHASAYLFFGSIWGNKPRILGGDPEKAKEYFEKNLAITNGNFLLTHVYYARYYAAKTLDEDLFVELLTKVQETSLEVLPEFRLLNAIAKQKAQRLLAQRTDLF